MGNETSENNYLNFEDPEEIVSSDTTTIDNTNDNNINLSPEDFANLARQASGYNTDHNTDIFAPQSHEVGSQKFSMEEEDNDSFLDEESKKVGLRSPYIKIAVGIFLTSTVVISLIFLRGGWLKIMNLSRKHDPIEEKSSVDPRKQEIDKLKAELALIEQSKKSIKPEPEPAPRPEPKPKPEPEPRPEPKPKPEPEAIDPYKQWELLSQLGTLGSSALDPNIANSARISRTVPNQSETSNSNDQSTAASLYRFPPDAQRIILGGLGVSPSKLKQTGNYSTADDSDSRQIASQLSDKYITSQRRELRQKQIPIATTIEGTITTPIIWTDNSLSSVTRATIILNEPLLYSDGDIALPEGASLIVEVSDWDDAGFVTLSVIAITYENSQGEFSQSTIPEGTFLIRNENHQPLAFKTEESHNENSLVRGLVSEALQSETRNLPLPGRFGSVVSRTIRNNSRRSRRSNSEIVYFIEEQTQVSIYVNSFLSIEN